VEKYSNLFKALSEPSRIRILNMLQLRPLCVCEITDVMKLKSSTISEHLAILRDNDLISSEKRGKLVFYKLNYESEDPSVIALKSVLLCSIAGDKTILSDREKAKKADCREILARKS
jgi:ArsR family transcriptional regulator